MLNSFGKVLSLQSVVGVDIMKIIMWSRVFVADIVEKGKYKWGL